MNAAALQTSMSLTPAVVDLGPVCVGTTARADVDVFANNLGKARVAFDLRERDRSRQAGACPHVDHDDPIIVLVGVGIRTPFDGREPDSLALVAGVIDDARFARLSAPHVPERRRARHAVPWLDPTRDQVIEAEFAWLCLEQPDGHAASVRRALFLRFRRISGFATSRG